MNCFQCSQSLETFSQLFSHFRHLHGLPSRGCEVRCGFGDCPQVEKEVRCRQNIYSVDEYQEIMIRPQAKANVLHLNNKFIELKKLPGMLGLSNRSAHRWNLTTAVHQVRSCILSPCGPHMLLCIRST